MRILHTADWHIGRTFHGHQTLDAIAQVLDAIPALVTAHEIDVVIAAGDIFDSAAPSAAAFELLQRTLLAIRAAGAKLVLISGNHDSAARLGFQAQFAKLGDVHIVTDPEQLDRPVTFSDPHGPVDFYCIPFLEPALIRHRWPDEHFRNQADALSFALRRIHAAQRDRPGARSVAVAHTFVSGAETESAESERQITVGSVDMVPISTFTGVDYVALGHVHGRMELAEQVRYPGALLHYSFSEAGKPRGGWLVELGTDGVTGATWLDLPVPRPLITLTGELDQLLGEDRYAAYHEHWVSAVLTDVTRPADAMRRLQRRFPWCAHVEHRPANATGPAAGSYAEQVQGKSDQQVLDAFLQHVRGGNGPSDPEQALLNEVIEDHTAKAALR